MAKRRNRPVKKSKNKANATDKAILKEAKNARERLRRYKAKYGTNENLPNAANLSYRKLKSTVSEYATVQDLIGYLKALNFDYFSSVSTYKNQYHVELTPDQQKTIRDNVRKANAAIKRAAKKYGTSAFLPKEFNATELMEGLVTKSSYDNLIEDLKLFNAQNLKPIQVGEEGTISTEAEQRYQLNVIERENQRRERKALEPLQADEGYFLMQEGYERKPIPEQLYNTPEKLSHISDVWSEKGRAYRANLFLDNQIKVMGKLQEILIMNQIYNKDVEARFNEIYTMILKSYNHLDFIDYISYRIPEISIENAYGVIESGGAGLQDVYNAWMEATTKWGI